MSPTVRIRHFRSCTPLDIERTLDRALRRRGDRCRYCIRLQSSSRHTSWDRTRTRRACSGARSRTVRRRSFRRTHRSRRKLGLCNWAYTRPRPAWVSGARRSLSTVARSRPEDSSVPHPQLARGPSEHRNRASPRPEAQRRVSLATQLACSCRGRFSLVMLAERKRHRVADGIALESHDAVLSHYDGLAPRDGLVLTDFGYLDAGFAIDSPFDRRAGRRAATPLHPAPCPRL
jgi:hypothetical protein